MHKKIIKYLTIFLLSSIIALPIFFPTSIFAKDACDTNLSPELSKAFGCEPAQANQLPTTIAGIVQGVIGVCGIVAVVFMIIGGVDIMTSSGDANKVKKGKDTIIYAAIGIVICALAFAAVNWVVGSILEQKSSAPSEETLDTSNAQEV